MAIGTELFLTPSGHINDVAKSIGLTIEWQEDFASIIEEAKLEEINKKLEAAWLEALPKIIPAGVKIEIAPAERGYYKLRVIEGGKGELKITPWSLALYYDPGEMGEKPEHALLAVSLISRYFPTFLDWHEPHGGSGNIIRLDKQTLHAIDIARHAIGMVLAPYHNSEIVVKELHY